MDQVKQLEEEIAAKKAMLKELKNKEKQNKLFAETAAGRVYFGALQGISYPFRKLGEYADNTMQDPRGATFQALVKKSNKLLTQMMSADKGDLKKSLKLVNKAAKLVVTIENLGYGSDTSIVQALRNEIEELRPPKSKEETEMFKHISNLINKEMETCNRTHTDTVMDSK